MALTKVTKELIDADLTISGGTVDNSVIGGSTAAAGSFTTLQGTTITATTAFVPDASDGAALGTTSLEFSDLYLADGAVVYLGDDQDVSLTHVADTGILLNSTSQLQFGDSGTYIHQSADGVLDLVSDTEIEINATTVDINGAVDVSGEIIAASLDISGNVDIDGTTNLDAVDIDGAVQIDGATTFGVNDTGVDVKLFGATSGAYILWDESADKLLTAGGAVVDIVKDKLLIGGTAVTTTAAELNKLAGAGTLKQAGKETIWIPATAMYPNTTGGCSELTQVALGTDKPDVKVLDFDKATSEIAQFTVAFPKSWDEGVVQFQAFWMATSTDNGDVVWGLRGSCCNDSDPAGTTFGTNVLSTAKAHSTTSNDVNVSAVSGDVTVANAAVDAITFFQIMRNVATDDLDADARLLGIKLFFTTDAANDA